MQNDEKITNPHTASAPTSASPNYGRTTDPNPGERSQSDQALGVPLNSLGVIPAQGNRAGGGRVIDAGAQVGIMRNLEFTAGGRAHRISTGTYSSASPAYDPKSGRIHFSTATEESARGVSFSSEDAKMERVDGAGKVNDTTTGDTSPDRRRDKDNV